MGPAGRGNSAACLLWIRKRGIWRDVRPNTMESGKVPRLLNQDEIDASAEIGVAAVEVMWNAEVCVAELSFGRPLRKSDFVN